MRAGRDRYRAESWRRAESFLRATVGDVDPVGIHIYGHGTEGGDAVGDDDGIDFVGGVTERLALLIHAGRGFSLNEGNNLRTFTADELCGLVVTEGFAPGFFKARDDGAVTLRHLTDALGEKSADEERQFSAGLDEVGDGSFHAAGAGGRDGDGQLILSSEDGAEAVAQILRYLEEVRVEVPNNRLRHRLIDARIDLAGARSVEQTLRWMDGSFNAGD